MTPVFNKADRAINRVAGAPVVGKANAEYERTGGTMSTGTAPISHITGEVIPVPAAPAPVAVTPTIIPGKTVTIEVPAAAPAKKKHREIAIDDGISRGAAAAGAGLLGGDSGLPIDPLGRRGRGAVGHATLLGR